MVQFINGGGRLLKSSQLNVVEIKTKKIKNFMINKSIAEALKLYYDSHEEVYLPKIRYFLRKTARRYLQPISRIAAWQMLNRYAKYMVGLNDGIGTHTPQDFLAITCTRKVWRWNIYRKC